MTSSHQQPALDPPADAAAQRAALLRRIDELESRLARLEQARDWSERERRRWMQAAAELEHCLAKIRGAGSAADAAHKPPGGSGARGFIAERLLPAHTRLGALARRLRRALNAKQP
jgi:hypothetical protein